MKCCYCGDSPETGKWFIPVEPAGTKDRKWACNACATNKQVQSAVKDLGSTVLEVTRIFDETFAR